MRIAHDPSPPLRNIVASPEQMELVEAVRPTLSPDEWEGFMAEHFGIEAA